MDYDVVIVGAGPAGCMTAKRLAELGVEVLLTEKRPEIGVPVRCGEATSVRGIRELGIELNRKFIANETRGAYIYSPNGTKVEMLSETPNGYVLERRIFDKFLGIYAAKAGAEVRAQTQAVELLKSNRAVKGVKLRHLGEEYEVECGCVVGADGIESKVGRWAGLNIQTKLSEMTSNAQFEIAGAALENPEVLEFYFGSKIAPRGYAWVFPKGKDVANVGLGVRDSAASALEYLKRFVSSKKNLRGSVIGIVAGAVPVQGPVEKSVGNGVLLVGDAARQVDPLTGGGIYNAMRCGTIAAEVLRKAVQKNDFSEKTLLEYDKRWRAAIGRVLLTSLKIKGILEKMSDEDLDAVARAMQAYKLNIDIKDVGTIVSSLPPNFVEFVQSLLNKN
jgi:digeranylgeranylglycerophospholipid reductase